MDFMYNEIGFLLLTAYSFPILAKIIIIEWERIFLPSKPA